MKKIFVNGYGSIGSRIVSFLKDDPELNVIGVGKYSPDDKVNIANSKGLDVYVPERKLNDFSDYKIAGSIESALDDCDLVVDAAPGGHGFKNKKNLFVSSTKSSIGHLLGAAGSVEAIFSILAIKNKVLPATLNLYNPIESGNINLIPKEPINETVNIALSNSFGFGGTNSTLIIRKFAP